MKSAAVLCAAAIALAACGKTPSAEAPAAAKAVEHTAPAGAYRLDPSHASLVFRVDHIGYSRYTASFADFDAALQFAPEDPAAMSVTATVDPRSLTLPAPPDGFHAALMGASWFNAEEFPQIAFRSTSVEQTGPATATVHGEMTFLGVTAPVSFDATFNGGYPGMEVYDPQARVGFSAYGTLKRSNWGMTEGLPPEGSNMGVGDEVEFFIEAEFLGPPLEPGKE